MMTCCKFHIESFFDSLEGHVPVFLLLVSYRITQQAYGRKPL